METNHHNLIDKALKESAKLEFKMQKIIKDFEIKTKTIVLLNVKENKLKIGIAVDIDKSNL